MRPECRSRWRRSRAIAWGDCHTNSAALSDYNSFCCSLPKLTLALGTISSGIPAVNAVLLGGRPSQDFRPRGRKLHGSAQVGNEQAIHKVTGRRLLPALVRELALAGCPSERRIERRPASLSKLRPSRGGKLVLRGNTTRLRTHDPLDSASIGCYPRNERCSRCSNAGKRRSWPPLTTWNRGNVG